MPPPKKPLFLYMPWMSVHYLVHSITSFLSFYCSMFYKHLIFLTPLQFRRWPQKSFLTSAHFISLQYSIKYLSGIYLKKNYFCSIILLENARPTITATKSARCLVESNWKHSSHIEIHCNQTNAHCRNQTLVVELKGTSVQ